MRGYTYGEREPVEECPCCGGKAYAEFCDVGVGMVQIEPYVCSDCGTSEEHTVRVQQPDGSWRWTWQRPLRPSKRGENVTGHIIRPNGFIFEMTFDEDHAAFVRRMKTSMSALLANGCIRTTNLEGFCIDLPPFMTREARRALKKVLDEVSEKWGRPYVRRFGETFGRDMSRGELAAAISRLPFEPNGAGPSIEDELEATASLEELSP